MRSDSSTVAFESSSAISSEVNARTSCSMVFGHCFIGSGFFMPSLIKKAVRNCRRVRTVPLRCPWERVGTFSRSQSISCRRCLVERSIFLDKVLHGIGDCPARIIPVGWRQVEAALKVFAGHFLIAARGHGFGEVLSRGLRDSLSPLREPEVIRGCVLRFLGLYRLPLLVRIDALEGEAQFPVSYFPDSGEECYPISHAWLPL